MPRFFVAALRSKKSSQLLSCCRAVLAVGGGKRWPLARTAAASPNPHWGSAGRAPRPPISAQNTPVSHCPTIIAVEFRYQVLLTLLRETELEISRSLWYPRDVTRVGNHRILWCCCGCCGCCRCCYNTGKSCPEKMKVQGRYGSEAHACMHTAQKKSVYFVFFKYKNDVVQG